MDKGVWEEAVREDADKEAIGPCDRCERRVCTKEREGVPVVKSSSSSLSFFYA